MTTSATEFPCIEATRCMLTEEEMGLRLDVKTLSNGSRNGYSGDLQNPHVVCFSKERSRKQEWYLHLDFSAASFKDEGTGNFRRVLQLRHSESGQYLSCDETGRVGCEATPTPSTYWWIERVHKTGSSPTKNGSSPRIGSPRSSSELLDESMDCQYILMSKEHAPRRLAYTTNLQGLNGSEDEYQLIGSKNSVNPSVWTIKFTSGELCFVVNPVFHCQLRCNIKGQIKMKSGMNGWAVFRFIEVGNGDLYISSWTHFTKFLTSDSDGKVDTIDTSTQSLGYSERWRLESAPAGNGLYIQSVITGRYLSVGRETSDHPWTTTKPNEYALWHIDAAHSHAYYLTSLFASSGGGNTTEGEVVENKTNHYNQIYSIEGVADMHVSSRKSGPYLTKNKQKWEEWKIEVTPDGDVTFFSLAHEKYLGCNSKGDVHTTTSKGAWTIWEKKVSPHGGVMFLSREHLRFLAVSETDGTLCTTPGDEETSLRHSWRMDPRLPRSMDGGMIAGALALATTAAMPFAVLGAIEAAGATVTELAILGISAEALAGVAAGAAIGVGIVGKTAASIFSKDAGQSPGEITERSADILLGEEHMGIQRPISAWKSWVKSV